jgi:hypothetical protein
LKNEGKSRRKNRQALKKMATRPSYGAILAHHAQKQKHKSCQLPQK